MPDPARLISLLAHSGAANRRIARLGLTLVADAGMPAPHADLASISRWRGRQSIISWDDPSSEDLARHPLRCPPKYRSRIRLNHVYLGTFEFHKQVVGGSPKGERAYA